MADWNVCLVDVDVQKNAIAQSEFTFEFKLRRPAIGILKSLLNCNISSLLLICHGVHLHIASNVVHSVAVGIWYPPGHGHCDHSDHDHSDNHLNVTSADSDHITQLLFHHL